MAMKIKALVLISFLILLIIGCDYYDDRLVINNESSTNLYVAFSRDTIIGIGENSAFMMPDYFVKAHTKKNVVEPGSKKAWEFFAEKSLNKEIHIFLLTEETVKKHTPSEIVNRRLFEKRIDIMIIDLEKNNWIVSFQK